MIVIIEENKEREEVARRIGDVFDDFLKDDVHDFEFEAKD